MFCRLLFAVLMALLTSPAWLRAGEYEVKSFLPAAPGYTVKSFLPARVVPAAQTFRSRGYNYNFFGVHQGHDCPACGKTSPRGEGTWIIRGWAGQYHFHQCPDPACAAVWGHK